jgi:hypothetical protein
MNKSLISLLVISAFLDSASICFSQNLLAKWTFENTSANSTNTYSPDLYAEEGEKKAVAVAIGFHDTNKTVWSNPAGNNSSKSFSANYWLPNSYFQFSLNSLSRSGISISWDQVSSGTGPTNFSLSYSIHGSTSTNFTRYTNYSVIRATTNPPNLFTTIGEKGSWSSSSYSVTNTTFSYDLSSITLLDNQPSLTLRLVHEGSGINVNGTSRIDNVSISFVPEPSSSMLLLLGAAGLIGLRSLRRKQS